MRLLFLLSLLPFFAHASPCLDACRVHTDRKAQLLCHLECERKDPQNSIKYCREFTPCLLACENRFPKETALDQAVKDEKTKCVGVCFTNYLKLDCKNSSYRPPGEPGGGHGVKQLGAQAPNADLALAGDSGLAGAGMAGAPSTAGGNLPAYKPAGARSEGVEAAIRSAEEATAKTLAAAGQPGVASGIAAEVGDQKKKSGDATPARPADEHLWNLRGGLKPQNFEAQPAAGSALAEVVTASLGEAGELTLFQRVTRAYRGTRYWHEAR